MAGDQMPGRDLAELGHLDPTARFGHGTAGMEPAALGDHHRARRVTRE